MMHMNSRLQDERNYCYNCVTLHELWTILSLVSFFLNYEGGFQVSSFKVFEESCEIQLGASSELGIK